MEEFEEMCGYEATDFLFSLSIINGEIDVCINPKSYWDNEHCQYDQHISGCLLNLPDELEEMAESDFLYSSGSDIDCINLLVGLGIKFNPDFQSFMEQHLNGPHRINGQLLSDYMIQNYPNSIV